MLGSKIVMFINLMLFLQITKHSYLLDLKSRVQELWLPGSSVIVEIIHIQRK